MDKHFNPFGRKSLTNDYGTYFNLFYYYLEATGRHPNVRDMGVPVKPSSVEAVLKMGAEEVFLCEAEKMRDGRSLVEPAEVCLRYKDAMVYFCRRDNILSRLEYARETYVGEEEEGEEEPAGEIPYRVKVLYAERATLEEVLAAVEREPERKKKGNVHLLCSMDGMLVLQRFDVRLPSEEIDLDLNYGPEAAMKFDRIVDHLSGNRNGLVLLSGDPGTGKSTFIKYLTTKTPRKVVYLTSGATEQLTSPDFLSFIMNHRNCVLLLEDAEKALRSRDSEDNGAISNILNITDGILGDCLNIMVIATFNIGREKIDPALARKGRLLVEHHFGPLDATRCERILEKTGSGRHASGPMTLAELYNPDDNFHEEEERRKVGF